MKEKDILNELNHLEAFADLMRANADTMKERCIRLRKKLGAGLGPASNSRKGRYAASSARVVANMRKTLFKSK